MVIGGQGILFGTEKCWLTEAGMDCIEQEPHLNNYENPGLFLVPENYCVP